MSLVVKLTLVLLSLSRSVVAIGPTNRFNESAEAPSECPFIFDKGVCKDVVSKYKYPCEEHTVTTDDGYILSIQRVKKDKDSFGNGTDDTDQPPILLQHGLFMDGVSFMLIGKESLVFQLADHGYDVWVANTRGTTYSRKHNDLDPSDKKFWDWSVDELVDYDFPATVNYVHDQTQKKLHYLGHSMGATIALRAMSTDKPEKDLIKSLLLTSPIVYMNHVLAPFTQIGAHLFMAKAREWLGIAEYSPLSRSSAEVAKIICAFPLINCSPFFLVITGPNCCLKESAIENFLSHGLQPSANKLLIHLAQNVRGEGLRKYDYGNATLNKEHYDSKIPPEYDLKKIPEDLPMFFGFGGLDFASDLIDVQFLMMNFWDHNNKKIVKKFLPTYAHGDFLMANNLAENLHRPLIGFLKANS